MDLPNVSVTFAAFQHTLETLEIVQQAVGVLSHQEDHNEAWSGRRLLRKECAEKVLGYRDQLLTTSKSLYRLVESWNGLSPVDKVPAEVLSNIFEFIAIDDKSPSLARITHVCRRWRDIGLGHSCLWAHPTLEPKYTHHPDFLLTILSRSGDALLSIDCTRGRDPSYPELPGLHDAYPQIMAQQARIRTLVISGLHACKYLFINQRTEPWRALETLHLKPMILHANKLLPQDWPRLKTLVLEEIGCSLWVQLGLLVPSIRSLHVTGWAGSVRLPDWTSALSQLPQLEILTIEHDRRGYNLLAVDTVIVESSNYRHTPPISLPHLRKLKMTLWDKEEYELMSHLVYPPEAEVAILWQNRGPVDANHTFILAQVLQTLQSKPGFRIPTHCRISLDSDIGHIVLGSGTTSPPSVRIEFDPRDASDVGVLLQAFFSAVDHLQYHLLTSQHFMMNHTGLLICAQNVRTLELVRLDVMDQIAMCSGGNKIPFPALRHLAIVVPPGSDVSVLPDSSTMKNIVTGLEDLLSMRKRSKHPITELTLCSWAQPPLLIDKIRKEMPDIVLHLD